MQEQTRKILTLANPEGMTLLDETRALREHARATDAKLQATTQTLQATLQATLQSTNQRLQATDRRVDAAHQVAYEHLRLVRRTTLDDRSNQSDHDIRVERNDRVHGGNVSVDIAVIREFGDDNHHQSILRTTKWKQAFYMRYGVPFRAADQILASPLEFQAVLNKRASVQSFSVWRDSAQEAGDIIALADELISLWNNEAVIDFAPGSRSRELLDEITRLCRHGYP